jgi:cytochrome P450
MSVSNTFPEIKFLDPQTLIEPYETYQTLRDEAPVYLVKDLGIYMVTRYDLLRDAIKDTETFSSKFDQVLGGAQMMAFEMAPQDVKDKLTAIQSEMIEVPPTMLTLDEPDHTRYRSLVSKLFTGSRIKSMQPHVQKVIDDTIASFVDGPAEIDFMKEFAFPVPLRIIADRLGIPEDGRDFFNDAATAAAAALRMVPLPPEEMLRRAKLGLDLQKFLVDIVEQRRRKPADDMITILANSKLEDEDRYLTHGECISVLNQFLVAGHETTTSTFGWGMYSLCRRPELQGQLRGNPANVKTFCEEAMRIETPVAGLPRVVTRDTELGGVALKAGSLIMLRYAAANRDERQFPNPTEIDLERKKAGLQMAFGSGVHHCIGAPLARQELNLGWLSLMDRMENIQLVPGEQPMAEPSLILRNLPTLKVTFNKCPS